MYPLIDALNDATSSFPLIKNSNLKQSVFTAENRLNRFGKSERANSRHAIFSPEIPQIVNILPIFGLPVIHNQTL